MYLSTSESWCSCLTPGRYIPRGRIIATIATSLWEYLWSFPEHLHWPRHLYTSIEFACQHCKVCISTIPTSQLGNQGAQGANGVPVESFGLEVLLYVERGREVFGYSILLPRPREPIHSNLGQDGLGFPVWRLSTANYLGSYSISMHMAGM